MDVAYAPAADVPRHASSPFLILKLRLHDGVVKIKLSVSAVWTFLIKLVHLDFDFQNLAIVILYPTVGLVLRTIYFTYKYCERNTPAWKKSIKDKKRWLNICWKKFKRWFWNTLTFGNALDVVAKLSDFAKIRKPMPGTLLSRMRHQYVDDVVRPGYMRVKFRWREQSWRRRFGLSTDLDNPWQLAKEPFLIADFKLEENGSLDLKQVAGCFTVDKLEVLSPGRLDAYPLADSMHISQIGIHTLTVRDGYITVVEHEDNLTRARKVFHQWLRGSLSYYLLRWIVLLSIVGSVIGAVGYLTYNVDRLFAALLFPIGFIYFQFYAMHMGTKYGFDWTPWPARRARGWVAPKYQQYL